MIDLKEITDKCYADKAGMCDCLADPNGICDYTCPFYKPVGCKDWIRVEDYIFAPEENERRFESEEDRKRRELYWIIRRVPKGEE